MSHKVKRRKARPLLAASAGLLLTIAGCGDDGLIANPLPPDLSIGDGLVSNPFPPDLSVIIISNPFDMPRPDGGSTD